MQITNLSNKECSLEDARPKSLRNSRCNALSLHDPSCTSTKRPKGISPFGILGHSLPHLLGSGHIPSHTRPRCCIRSISILAENFNRSLLIEFNYVFLSVSCHVHPHEFASVSVAVQTQDLVHSMNWSLWCFTPTDKTSTQIPSRWVVFYQRGWSLQLKSNFSRNIFPFDVGSFFSSRSRANFSGISFPRIINTRMKPSFLSKFSFAPHLINGGAKSPRNGFQNA
jgi:hypothetical protein